jgi:hypothetical protein
VKQVLIEKYGGGIMKRYVLALLMVMWACSAVAETWEWVDAQGTVSFTDDPQNIPKQYRKSAKMIGGESPPPSQSAASPVPAPAPVPVGADAKGTVSPAQPGTSTAPAPGVKLQDNYGGKTAADWKAAFSSLNGEIREVDGQLKEKQRLLKEPGTLSRSDYMKLDDEIRRLSSSLTALLARWELLNKEATVAGVPGELRQ